MYLVPAEVLKVMADAAPVPQGCIDSEGTSITLGDWVEYIGKKRLVLKGCITEVHDDKIKIAGILTVNSKLVRLLPRDDKASWEDCPWQP